MNFYYKKFSKPGWFIKRKFLEFVFNDKSSGKSDTVTKSSWRSLKSVELGLYELYHKYLNPIISEEIGPHQNNRMWYQVYGKNTDSCHTYHQHYDQYASLSGIYYLKLKDLRQSTVFLHEGKFEIPEISEGDLVIFDAKVLHQSPPCRSNHDKIVVSFNLLPENDHPKLATQFG